MQGQQWKLHYRRPGDMAKDRSLAQAMGLKRADPAFSGFTRSLRVLAIRYLDETCRLKEQDPKRWKTFCHEALEETPFIAKYDGCWPIEAYMNKRLEQSAAAYRKRVREKNNAAHLRQPTVPKDTGGNGHGNPKSRRNKASATYHYQSREVLSSASASSSGCSTRDSQPAAACLNPGVNTETVANQARPSTGDSPFQARKEAVRDFLKGLKPSMEDLTPMFISAGLVNRECFIALAGMPDWEKDKLLRDDMSLSAFQMRVVRIGLVEMRK